MQKTIAEYQTGFRREKSTTDYVFTDKTTNGRIYEYNKDLHILFVDFKQAHVSIDWEQLLVALKKFSIPRKLVKLVEICNQQIY